MTAVPAPEPPDPALLTAYLDAPYGDIAQKVRADLGRTVDLLERQPDEPRDSYQELVLDALQSLIAGGNAGLGFPVEHGGGGDIGGSVVAFQNLAYSDLSLLVKAGVQFGLFGGAILHLGTQRHHDRYLADLVAGRLLGCFAMTETAHGSNVHDLETTATYDPATDALVIETPTESARKDYIGNVARDGHAAVVFAQLVVGDEGRGVHAIVVPIRDAHGKVCPGVRIEDCGPKLGLNGVDNGRIWFHQVRVPRESLLNRYADVTPDGRYLSAIENPDRRFFTMIGTLVQGRVSVGGGALYASRVALATAVRHANRRRQFGPPGGVREATLMTYRTHQRRLLPLLARSYALSAAQREVVAMLHESLGADRRGSTQSELPDRRILEARAAGQKALATWFATEAIQACREACGGAGYLAENR